jgi:DNA-binding response OmpR family regulator
MKQELIMVADEDSRAARALARSLSRRRLKASYTASGEEVVSLACSGRLRLAIVDEILKDMSGLMLAAQLKAINPAIPVLMTSADHRPELEIQARQAGILYYAHKPTNYRRLEAVVRKALSNARWE